MLAKKNRSSHVSAGMYNDFPLLAAAIFVQYTGDVEGTHSKIFRVGSEKLSPPPQQLGGAANQGAQTPKTPKSSSSKVPTLDSDITRPHPVAGGACKQETSGT